MKRKGVNKAKQAPQAKMPQDSGEDEPAVSDELFEGLESTSD